MTSWVGNFEFENELGGNCQSRGLQLLSREFLGNFVLLADEGDSICGMAVPAEYWREIGQLVEGLCVGSEPLTVGRGPVSVQPWGLSRDVVIRHKIDVAGELVEAVRRVNSRSFALELSSKIESDRLCVELSQDDLQQLESTGSLAAQDFDQPFAASGKLVIKSEFGMSGREQLRVMVGELTPPQSGWIRNRMNRGVRLFSEPWLESHGEVSLHWDVPANGNQLTFVGVTDIVTDAQGRFRGNRFDEKLRSRLVDWESLFAQARAVALTVQQAGYVGPLGIDCMRYWHPEGDRWRVTQDINARWSMGRVAIEGTRKLKAQSGRLMHHRLDSLPDAVNEHADVTDVMRQFYADPTIDLAVRVTPRVIDDYQLKQASILSVWS